jgi:ABC-type methionine transport system permease subunit
MLRNLTIVLGTFVAASALAGLLGAANLGIALSFGQMGFAAALVYVLLRR